MRGRLSYRKYESKRQSLKLSDLIRNGEFWLQSLEVAEDLRGVVVKDVLGIATLCFDMTHAISEPDFFEYHERGGKHYVGLLDSSDSYSLETLICIDQTGAVYSE